jgi:cytochrome c oxidase subunit 2
MALAVAILVLVVGSIVFHLLSPWYLTDLASNWGAIDTTIDITFWVTGIVFVLVNLFMAYAIYRFRHKSGQKADYEPENKGLEFWLTVATAAGVAAMLAPGLWVWAKFVEVPEDAATVEAIGQQWHWTFRYPGADGKLGTVNSSLISEDNPYGLNPDDPNGQDDVLVARPELHLPVDRPVKILMRSKDVLHDFAVAQFRVKMDLVPGMVTYLWLTPTKTGRFELLCEELCGMAHHTMRGHVVVEESGDFDDWLAMQPTFADTQSSVGDAQLGAASYNVCAACHGTSGEGNKAMNAPKLAGQYSWYLKRQLEYFKNGVRGQHEDDVYGRQMAPMAATLVNESMIDNIVAYIGTLPDVPVEETVDGNRAHGAEIYETCVSCHGRNGQGIWTANAPRQSGINDWYLVTQLNNFRKGIRGSHDADLYGDQMIAMSKVLKNEQDVRDVVAYINSMQ